METVNKTENNRNELIETTFKDIGLRAANKIPEHLLRENGYKSNLIADISTVDYTKDNMGQTTLQEIPGFTVFIDDMYIYGYLRKQDVVYSKTGRVQCTTGPKGQIRTLTNHILCKDLPNYAPSNIVFTVAMEDKTESIILNTIKKIEKNKPLLPAWQEHNANEEPETAFVVKVDVSNVPIEKIEENIQELEKNLNSRHYGLYSVDYTQDYSGTLQKETIEEYYTEILGFRKQNEPGPDSKYTILDNYRSVGNNVITFLHKDIGTGNLHRVKLYNKIVSTLEAGEVKAGIGGHIADYVYSSSDRLRRLFYTKEVQERGLTRLEITIYGGQNNISKETGLETLQKYITKVNPPDNPLYVIQPGRKQYLLLAEKINKCLCVVDRPNFKIYLGWYVNTTTGRIGGVKADFSKLVEEQIENFIKWFIADLGFRMVPIFRIDILKTDNNIVLDSLRCYVKNPDSYTILTPCNQPTIVYKNAPKPEYYLPDTEYVRWAWREKKPAEYSKRKPIQELQEEPEIASKYEISILSLSKRREIQAEIEEAKEQQLWRDNTERIIENIAGPIKQIKEDLELIKKHVEIRAKRKELLEKTYNTIIQIYKENNIQKICNIEPGQYRFIAWKEGKYSPVVVLEKDKETVVIYATKNIIKVIEVFKPYFIFSKTPDKKDLYYFLPDGNNNKYYFIYNNTTNTILFYTAKDGLLQPY